MRPAGPVTGLLPTRIPSMSLPVLRACALLLLAAFAVAAAPGVDDGERRHDDDAHHLLLIRIADAPP